MPSWGEILGELAVSGQGRGGLPDFDGIRRKYLTQLHQLTGRNTILYATRWLNGSGGADVLITLEDMQGMMEVCRGLTAPNLDIILHSPGGVPEATASIVRYLRQKFSDIRVFVPLAAMSAATMWSLASNRIVMGKHSQLGPIDPQIVTAIGQHPARAIIKQFDRGVDECSKDPSKLAAWLPILQQYGPSLLEQCESAERLAKRLVREWLQSYMLVDLPNAAQKAAEISDYFADYDERLSYGLGIPRDEARNIGVVIEDLETDQALQDAVLSVHHAAIHTLTMGPALKIIENHMGRGFFKIAPSIQIPMGGQAGMQLLPQNLLPLQFPQPPSIQP